MSTLIPADILNGRNRLVEWQLQKATNEVFEGTGVKIQALLKSAASLHMLCKNSYIFSRHVCDMIDDPTNQTLSNPVLTIRMLYKIQDVQSISKMSYLCINLTVKNS